MKEHSDQGTIIFLTDAMGDYAGSYKRMLVVIVDGRIRACLPQPKTVTTMMRGENVLYHPLDPKNVTDKTGRVLPAWMKEQIETWLETQLRDALNKAFPDPFKATEAIQ